MTEMAYLECWACAGRFVNIRDDQRARLVPGVIPDASMFVHVNGEPLVNGQELTCDSCGEFWPNVRTSNGGGVIFFESYIRQDGEERPDRIEGPRPLPIPAVYLERLAVDKGV